MEKIEPIEIYPVPSSNNKCPSGSEPVITEPDNYYTKAETDSLLADKVDQSQLSDYYDKTEINRMLPDLNDYYNKTETDSLLQNKVNNSTLNNYYTKTQVNNLLPDMSDYYDKTAIDSMLPDMEDYYNKTETDSLLQNKVNNSTLNNYYTKTQVNNLLPDMSDYYSKSETDSLLQNKVNNSTLNNYYTAAEVNALLPDMSDYYNKTETDSLLQNKVDNSILNNYYTSAQVDDLLNAGNIVSPSISNATNYNNYGNTYYYVKNKRVHVHVGVSGLTVNTVANLFTLPSGYRPRTTVVSCGYGQTRTGICNLSINTGGVVSIYSSTTYAIADIDFDIF